MSTGTITSGIGHGALILWLLLGDWLFSPPEPEDVTSIGGEIISEADYQALVAAAASTPEPAEVPAEPEVVEPPPEPEVVEPPVEPEVVEPPVEPEVVEPPVEPEVVEPAPEPEVVETPPEPVEPGPTAPDVDASDLPAAEELQALPSTATSIRPKPRPAEIVSTDPTVSEEEPTAEAEPVEATTPSETAEPVEPVEPTEAVVEQDTGDVLETEAVEEQEASLGMTSSPRPQARPERPAVTEVADAPAEEPAEEQTTETAAAEDPLADIVGDVVAESEATNDGGSDAPQGPPMTAGEKEGLRVAVNRCWNVGALSTEALRVTVTVYVSLGQDGKPISSSVEMAGFEGGSEGAARQAFEAAKRAIIRCGSDGYDLPAEKYEEWKELSIVFDPNGMRMR